MVVILFLPTGIAGLVERLRAMLGRMSLGGARTISGRTAPSAPSEEGA